MPQSWLSLRVRHHYCVLFNQSSLKWNNRYPGVDQLRFTNGSLADMTVYYFHTKTNPHYFCPVCGSGLLEDGTERSKRFGVNVRCVEGVDLDKLTYKDEDGLNEL
jgi:hypothetical protein